MLDLFACYGYELVMPPLIEYLESLLIGSRPAISTCAPSSWSTSCRGRLLGVRADMTPQVARIDAHLLNRNGVTRLCYAGSVLHTRPSGLHATREPLQIGAEIYGHAGLGADIEIVELLVLSLRADRHVGHPPRSRPSGRAARAAGAGCRRQPMPRRRSVAALRAKDQRRPARARAPAAAGDPRRAAGACRTCTATLARARRGARDVLPALDRRVGARSMRSRALPSVSGRSRQHRPGRPARLPAITAACCSSPTSPGLPNAVARGGRYDDIGRSFGRSRPATGFSIDLRDLSRLLPAADGASGDPRAGAGRRLRCNAFVRALRAQGEVVVRQLEGDAVPDGRDFDREIRRRGDGWAVVPQAFIRQGHRHGKERRRHRHPVGRRRQGQDRRLADRAGRTAWCGSRAATTPATRS